MPLAMKDLVLRSAFLIWGRLVCIGALTKEGVLNSCNSVGSKIGVW